ncbi:TPA: YeeE/YedE family protein [Legionella pneumophila]|nr:YeeE/YedE family protein [Legionella pneumophila]MDW8879178.1 YeeE/YedE family protein [Legionella pneumophila subsp. fraseri]MDW8961656.1 YeeE/YedE family protein [Legionella pneumophila subsp. fraseri]MDW9034409.1 YeeE/YedE family protein [Legionella pneumophila subsp. fraseri]MDW9037915.1 YeeE/YedE family protein [Legionella pneumophila subsp. fraseri]MDW9040530.1 YeeE/YedE family protein [Legionella pneumophila subsp. fraseri]
MDYITLFTPYLSAIGGLLIGLSAVLFLWLNGRIAGISGMIHGLCPPEKPFTVWRIAFLFGLAVAGLFYFVSPVVQFPLRTHYPVFLLLIGGFFVGFGTRMGQGCTSGHGVCGLARFSKRSFIATLLFILSAVITVYLIRHIGGLY